MDAQEYRKAEETSEYMQHVCVQRVKNVIEFLLVVITVAMVAACGS